MKKTRRTTEQIIRILCDSEGLSVDEACRRHEISAPTYHRWKAKYGGMGIKEVQRLRDIEKENSELKKLLAEQMPVIGEDDAGLTQRIDEFTVQALAAEDYSSIAQTVSQLTRTMESEIEALRQKAISVSQEYAQDKYHLRFRQFWEAILSHPPVANPPTRRRRASLMDQIPMGLLRRLDSRALFRKQPLF